MRDGAIEDISRFGHADSAHQSNDADMAATDSLAGETVVVGLHQKEPVRDVGPR